MTSAHGGGATVLLVIVQARMGSSRLPGKVLAEAGGRTLLEHLIRALRASKHHPEIVVATTTAAADSALVAAAERLGVRTFRGSESDVLARYAGALAAHPAEVVVRVTADCPLLDTAELDRTIAEFYRLRATAAEVDYLTNQDGAARRIPHGADVEVMSARTLERSARQAQADHEREHVTPYIYAHPEQFRIARSHYPGRDLSRYRITVDTAEDLALVRRVVEALGPNPQLEAVAEFLDTHPEVSALNAAIEQKAVLSEKELWRDKISGRLLVGRADAGSEIGSGHVTRVGALLAAWCELGGRGMLFGSGIVGSSRERLLGAGVQIVDADGAGAATDPERLLALSRAGKAAAIALDGYSFDASYQRRLAAEFTLLTLDDLAAFAPVAQLVVNQNLGFPAEAYPAAPATRVLVGAAYVLLRPELREAARLVLGSAASVTAPRILISFGGADPRGLTLPLARALLPRLPPRARVTALLGCATAPRLDRELDGLAATDPRLIVRKDVTHVEHALLDADLAILGAGTTTWEALALGIPVLAVVTSAAQRVVAEGLQRFAAARVFGLTDELGDLEHLASEVIELANRPDERATLSARGRALIDGRGVWRVIDALLTCAERNPSRAA